MSKDLKNALRSTRDMDEYLEVRSSQEIIDDIKALAGQETLRDQFAGQAIASLISLTQTHSGAWDEVAVAAGAYSVADAMLEARKSSSLEQSGSGK